MMNNFYFLSACKARESHPSINAIPPKGVIAPSGLISVKTRV